MDILKNITTSSTDFMCIIYLWFAFLQGPYRQLAQPSEKVLRLLHAQQPVVSHTRCWSGLRTILRPQPPTNWVSFKKQYCKGSRKVFEMLLWFQAVWVRVRLHPVPLLLPQRVRMRQQKGGGVHARPEPSPGVPDPRDAYCGCTQPPAVRHDLLSPQHVHQSLFVINDRSVNLDHSTKHKRAPYQVLKHIFLKSQTTKPSMIKPIKIVWIFL